jgi:hypothetical protein
MKPRSSWGRPPQILWARSAPDLAQAAIFTQNLTQVPACCTFPSIYGTAVVSCVASSQSEVLSFRSGLRDVWVHRLDPSTCETATLDVVVPLNRGRRGILERPATTKQRDICEGNKRDIRHE